MPRLSGQDSELSQNRTHVLSMCSLGTKTGIKWSWNRTRNRVLVIDSLGTRDSRKTKIGIVIVLEPGTSGFDSCSTSIAIKIVAINSKKDSGHTWQDTQ